VTQSQTASSPSKSDLQAMQLLTIAFQTVGGAQRAGLADVRLEGTLRSPDAPDVIIGTFVAKVRGEDWAVETTFGSHTSKYRVLNGAGTLDDGSSTKFFHPSITSGTRLDIFPLFQRWTEFNQPGSAASVVGPATLDGVACTHIHVHSGLTNPHPAERNQHGDVDVLVDSSTGLIAAVRYKAMLGMPNPHPMEVENRFARYERLNGLMVATRITRYLAGQPLTVFQVTAIQTNNAFTDQDFRNRGGNGQ
jgi:hypothetical protein